MSLLGNEVMNSTACLLILQLDDIVILIMCSIYVDMHVDLTRHSIVGLVMYMVLT